MPVQSPTKPQQERVGTPDLSVVIASVNGWDVLEPTLKALDAQPERPYMQVIVVEATGEAVRERLRAHTPAVEVIEAERQPIPKLRHVGVCQAGGKLVAILEDHGQVGKDWAKSILKAHEGPWAAVGGAVENGKRGLVNWAVYFCEYTPYMKPVAEGEAADLPGNNIAYKRPHLMRHAHVLADGKWESWINDRLRADGVPIASTNSVVVHHIKTFKLGYFIVQRFHFARSYAGMRRGDQSWPKRLIYGFGSMALPAMLMARVTKTVLGKKRHLGRFLLVSPLVALFLSVGAFGEMVGYLVGPGSSLDKVE
ncbi:glycosyltransferase [Singulisphaera sp. PoT]|uniref:glycosyltransferase n=1 Tax=Singulisphaera sp. PoT TaxID=3411797 RepID=UPI003BF5B320